jgi:hypothetical protein
MANSLTNILDKILAQGLSTLREAAIMPRLTRSFTGAEAAQKGTTIDIPKPVSQTVGDVTARPTHTSAASKTPKLVQLTLDQWKSTDFYLNDKELTEIDRNRHFMPMQTAEAARAMANNLDTAILNNYKGIHGYVGTAGSNPFSTIADATNANKVLNEHLAPNAPRYVVLNPAAESQALQLAAFSDLEKTGDRAVKIEGELGRKFGMDWFMDQNIVTHTAGTAVSVLVGSTTAAGASTIQLKTGTSASAGTLLIGDIFTIAGQTETYTVLTSATNVSVAIAAVRIDPPLAAIATANAVVDKKATHVVNLAFHPNAFGWGTRPLQEATADINNNMSRTMTDPVSGVTMRLEVIRQNKQTEWEFDFLYGTQLLRPELAVRIAG